VTDFWIYNPSTKLLYRIVTLDQEGGKVKLKAMDTGIEFEDSLNIAAYKKTGYELLTTAQVNERGLLKD